jgi:hypothetical protein
MVDVANETSSKTGGQSLPQRMLRAHSERLRNPVQSCVVGRLRGDVAAVVV